MVFATLGPMTDHDATLDALTKQLVQAGLVELFTDDDGDEAMRSTPEGERVARQLAMTTTRRRCWRRCSGSSGHRQPRRRD